MSVIRPTAPACESSARRGARCMTSPWPLGSLESLGERPVHAQIPSATGSNRSGSPWREKNSQLCQGRAQEKGHLSRLLKGQSVAS